MKYPLLFLSLLLSPLASGTAYTVKSSGGSFTTFAACAAVAVGGDSCTAFASASPQAGWTQPASGSAGNPITFTKNVGDTVTITSTVTLNGKSYVTLNGGLAFSASSAIVGNNSTQHCVIDGDTFSGNSGFRIPDGAGGGGSDNVVSNNIFTRNSGTAGGSTTTPSLYLYGDRTRVENNEFAGGSSDAMEIGGNNFVIRGNYFHDVSGVTSAEHIDFVQVIGGGTSPTLAFSLMEANIEKTCSNQCHLIIVRTGSGPVADTVIVRENFGYNMALSGGGSGASYGGVGDSAPNGWFYNNTLATLGSTAENGDGVSYQNAPNGVVLNNIFYQTQANSWSPTVGLSFGNANITFNSGYASTWNSPYSTEATYSTLRNLDPLFLNYPADVSLQSGSPARSAGVSLTTAVGAGASSATLTVANAHGLQPGWAGTQGDWIRIGSATTRQISSINYSTNVITLTSSATWANADAIYLYKDSDGTVVLNNLKPDVGAYQYSAPVAATTAGNTPALNQRGAQFVGMTSYKNDKPGGQTVTQGTPTIGTSNNTVPTWCRVWNLDGTAPLALAPTTRGTYVWTKFDAVLDKCFAAGQQIEWVAATWPTWVTGNTTHACWTTLGACDPPDDLSSSVACQGTLTGTTTNACKAREIVADVLLHASARGTPITAVSVGNETNFCDSTGTADAACHVTAEVEWTSTIANHVKLAKALRDTMLLTQPSVLIWGPSATAMDNGSCSSGTGGERWLDRWYLEWITNQSYPVIDGVTFHGYTSSAGSWTNPELVDQMMARAFNGTDATGTTYSTCTNTKAMLTLGAYLIDDEDSWGTQTLNGVPVSTIARTSNTVTLVTFGDGGFSAADSLIVPQVDGCGTGAPWNGTFVLGTASTTTLTYPNSGTNQSTCTPSNVPVVMTTTNWNLQRDYMRKLLIEYSRGVRYKLWYTFYANSSASGFWGTLCSGRTSTACQTLSGGGVAMGEIYKWLGNLRPSGICTVTASVWKCNYSSSNGDGYSAQAVWYVGGGTSSYTYPVNYTQYRSLDGTTTSLSPTTVTIGTAPILLESFTGSHSPARRKAMTF